MFMAGLVLPETFVAATSATNDSWDYKRVAALTGMVNLSKRSYTAEAYHPYTTTAVPYMRCPYSSYNEATKAVKVLVVGTAKPVDPSGKDAGLSIDLLSEKDEVISAIWIKDQDGRVLHLTEFDPKSGFSTERAGDDTWPTATLPIHAGKVRSVTAYSFSAKTGIWEGNTVSVPALKLEL